MFQLTNDQRRCFGLSPITQSHRLLPVKAGPNDYFHTLAVIREHCVEKVITVGTNQYCEYGIKAALSDDDTLILPKTARGKPKPLTTSSLLKQNPAGMCLSFDHGRIDLFNADTECCFYHSCFEYLPLSDISDFESWVNGWCADTTEDDLRKIAAFAKDKRQHVTYREGDFFRFPVTRRLYGYGRVLLDYGRMRREKQEFWDILMGKPLVVCIYHILTENSNITPEQLMILKSLPSCLIADNALYYGEYPVIGNRPVEENADYPICYGESITIGDHSVHLQIGKIHRQKPNEAALYHTFRNNGVAFLPNVRKPVLEQCIAEGSNRPYWEQSDYAPVEGDLRNPKFKDALECVKKQFEIENL